MTSALAVVRCEGQVIAGIHVDAGVHLAVLADRASKCSSPYVVLDLVLGTLSPLVSAYGHPVGATSADEIDRHDLVDRLEQKEGPMLSEFLVMRLGTCASYGVLGGLCLSAAGFRAELCRTSVHAAPSKRHFLLLDGQPIDLFARATGVKDELGYRAEKTLFTFN